MAKSSCCLSFFTHPNTASYFFVDFFALDTIVKPYQLWKFICFRWKVATSSHSRAALAATIDSCADVCVCVCLCHTHKLPHPPPKIALSACKWRANKRQTIDGSLVRATQEECGEILAIFSGMLSFKGPYCIGLLFRTTTTPSFSSAPLTIIVLEEFYYSVFHRVTSFFRGVFRKKMHLRHTYRNMKQLIRWWGY